MLAYINIFILVWLSGLSICESEWVVDSDQIYGIREPDGFTRENISCSPELSIAITSVAYGYKVRNYLAIKICMTVSYRTQVKFLYVEKV